VTEGRDLTPEEWAEDRRRAQAVVTEFMRRIAAARIPDPTPESHPDEETE
jgi:hypothetical protein